MPSHQKWKVLGGAVSGGVLVRIGKELGSSRLADRLGTGALVQELQLTGDRLKYRLLAGSGPPEGWVSVKLGSKELLQRCTEQGFAWKAQKGSVDEEVITPPVLEIFDLALNVAAMVQIGPKFRVSKVCNEKLLEVSPSEEPVGPEDFWPPDCTFSVEQRHYLYWAIVCCSSCDTWTLALALALKELSDHGVVLAHEGKPVVNIVVMNTPTMDIGDLLPTAVEFLEPISGARIPMFSTPASQLALRAMGNEVQERLGWGVASMFDEQLRKNFVDEFGDSSLTHTVPHWWIAAIVQGYYGRYMVHVDLCGPAYGTFCGRSSGGKRLPMGQELPLDIFVTPLWLMIPSATKHLFLLSSEAWVDFAPEDARFTDLARIRHFRCLVHGTTGYVAATPLPQYVDDKLGGSWLHLRTPSPEAIPDLKFWQEQWQEMASFIRVSLLKHFLPGSQVQVREDASVDPELIEKVGKILARSGSESMLVQIDGISEPVKVEVCALRGFPQYVQYFTLAEMQQEAMMYSVYRQQAAGVDRLNHPDRLPDTLEAYLRSLHNM